MKLFKGKIIWSITQMNCYNIKMQFCIGLLLWWGGLVLTLFSFEKYWQVLAGQNCFDRHYWWHHMHLPHAFSMGMCWLLYPCHWVLYIVDVEQSILNWIFILLERYSSCTRLQFYSKWTAKSLFLSSVGVFYGLFHTILTSSFSEWGCQTQNGNSWWNVGLFGGVCITTASI